MSAIEIWVEEIEQNPRCRKRVLSQLQLNIICYYFLIDKFVKFARINLWIHTEMFLNTNYSISTIQNVIQFLKTSYWRNWNSKIQKILACSYFTTQAAPSINKIIKHSFYAYLMHDAHTTSEIKYSNIRIVKYSNTTLNSNIRWQP